LGLGSLFWQEVWFDHPVYRKSKCWKRNRWGFTTGWVGLVVFLELTVGRFR
jgi:hypothetical protein